ncbi:unnamed protein product [Trifolium pratense]|uniref:Uncharacterized protein n=1 Tax=Trifolium pratense TaxID=57577 RepID=A0ACB0KIT2_TRIPR|nr:unnamed protein product [Trifolium pratense]
MFESTSSIIDFTRAWGKSNNDQWETLDFSMLKSDFIKTKSEPYVWVNSRCDNFLYKLLFVALNLSQGNIKTLLFHYNLFLSNDQFSCIARRCPLVRRIVFVSWNRIKKVEIRKAIRGWNDLESMTMPPLKDPTYVFQEISKNCKNFRELKVMGRLDKRFALSLVTYLPNLKVLSVRCSVLVKEALILVLESLKYLEVLNVSHSYFVVPISHIDRNTICEKASKLRQFVTCMEKPCIMCDRTRMDCGLSRWHKFKEGIWKDDEVSSLAL